MSLIIETNSYNINAIPCDKIVLIVNKGTMLRDIREKSSNEGAKSGEKGVMSGEKGVKSGEKGAMSGEKGAMSGDKGAMSGEKGAKLSDKGAKSVGKAQKLKDFEVFEKTGFFIRYM